MILTNSQNHRIVPVELTNSETSVSCAVITTNPQSRLWWEADGIKYPQGEAVRLVCFQVSNLPPPGGIALLCGACNTKQSRGGQSHAR